MPVRVLVTRPKPGNEQTARRLIASGFEPVLLPLTEVSPCAPEKIEVSPDTEAVAITSPNALRFAPDSLMARIRKLPVYAVGEASARFAGQCGLRVAAFASGSASSLAELVARSLKKGAHIAYPCGKVRRPDFERAMSSAGFIVDPIETYDTKIVSYLTNSIAGKLGKGEIDAVFLHSANTGQALDALISEERIPQISEKTWYFCFSGTIADSLKSVSKTRIFVAAEPNDTELISAAKRILG